VTSDPSPDLTPTLGGDEETNVRRSVGRDGASANGSAPSSSNDPMKIARQAIRSQTWARDYAERQLIQAQTAIQELRTRLRHVHQEREAAVVAAQSAIAARSNAERTLASTETALATERSARDRTNRALQDAEATIRDLREKLATANQTLNMVQAEMAAERLARPEAEDALRSVIAAREVVAPPIQDASVPMVRRPVGRPRKTAMAQPIETIITPPKKPLVLREGIPANQDEAAVPIIRRPVGRPRKIVVVEPIETSARQPGKSSASGKNVAKKTNKPKKVERQSADDQEPVQWWVEGWRGR
jgi:hypothetical protein